MNKQLLLLSLIFHCWLTSSIAQKPALFYRAGVEIGGAISAFVPEAVNIPIYNNRLGGRLGVYAMHRLKKSLDLRTGIFYTLRGVAFGQGDQQNPYNQDRFWHLENISAPIMLFYHLSSQVNVALGVELNAIVGSNIPVSYGGLDLGIRGSCGFYIIPKCRIAAYYTHGLANHWLYGVPVNSNITPPYSYKNIIAGISVSFELHHKKDYSEAPKFKNPCPRLVQQSYPIRF